MKRDWLKASRLYWLVLLVLGLWLAKTLVSQEQPAQRSVPYSQLVGDVRDGKVTRLQITDEQVIAELKPEPDSGGKQARAQIVTATRLPKMDDATLVQEAIAHGVVVSGRREETSWWWPMFFSTILPLAIMIALWSFMARRLSGPRGGALSFGKNRAKVYDVSRTDRVTFTDVAGVDEAKDELREVVDFLRHPQKFKKIGARIPKGVLLLGAPGTGKTLLARAVAGEASVPFFSMSGSEFVEMFVGVGASRVRDLFEQAKARAPCIIFIDEVDAIGRSRGGVGALATHDEREQTLNQLLAEMDGFETGLGVVIMAATNRPEILDPALVRAGRFDRQVVVDRPDIQGRLAILDVHADKVKLAPEVDLTVIARRTPGMVGADLAKVVNEAALAAARRGVAAVEQLDFEEAIDRIQLGLKKRGRAMSDAEKRRVAYHESGHALAALSVDHADPVHRVTIIPRSVGSLGATLQLPTEDRYLVTREELVDRLCVMLAGRAAEDMIFGTSSTGAQNDLERATETARQMVCRFGMSDRLGPQTFGRPSGMRFLEVPMGFDERNFGDETAYAIDSEVTGLLASAYARAKELLEARRAALERVAERLLIVETLERDELDAIVADGWTPRESSVAMRH